MKINKFILLIFLTSVYIKPAQAMTEVERESLLNESSNYGNSLGADVNVGELQTTVDVVPAPNEAELAKLKSYKDNEGQMKVDGSAKLQESNDFFIKDRSIYNFTESDPLITKAEQIRTSDGTLCETNTTTKTGTDTEIISKIDTCEIYKTYEMQYCNKTTTAGYTCNLSTNNIYDRNGADKVMLNIACADKDTISVTVDAWGGEGKCVGPITIPINLNTQINDWTNLTVLKPHWEGSCADLPVSYKGGCVVSCPGGTCVETCDYSFKFEGLYNNIADFSFSRLNLTENDGCTWYEGCANGGDCGNFDSGEFYTETCIDSTCRTINGQSVCPSCWNWKSEYGMFSTVNNCETLINNGCGQIGSTCVTKNQSGSCTLIENKYDCSYSVQDSVTTGTSSTVNCNNDIPCVGDSCFDITSTANKDFKQTATYLAIADQITQEVDLNGQIVFSGVNSQCSEYILNAKSCCDTNPGYILSCSAQEKELATARSENVTHYVGSYCASKSLFGTCLEKKESYCVFNSVLARIIQQQGKTQLGKGWGSPESPDCSAFTLNEIQSLNFESMDFSDFLGTLEYNKTPDTSYNPENFNGNP